MAIDGIEASTAKTSAVDARGSLTQQLIDGVSFRSTRPVAHDDGTLAEILRRDWPEVQAEVVQVHLTTTEPGHVRGWGVHQRSTDRLFVVKGLVSIVVYDARVESATHGMLNKFIVSERSPGLLTIAPNLYHGWKVLGPDEAFIINMPTVAYDHAQPDALDLPYESADAARIVPFRW
jgi:dTDP-4-dehydrorhamnose 3,5-epimerase